MKPFALLLLLLLSFSRVFADGAYKHLLLAEPAQIPRQSAAIHFADGKETLTIWNTVEAKGQDLAWVLPLPAKPELIRPSHPNAFQLLQWLTAPKVEDGRGDAVLRSGILLLLGLGLLLVRRSRRLWLIPAATVCLVFFVFIMFPETKSTFRNSGGGGPVAGVEVLSAQDVGQYETTVIAGTSAEAVNDWLRAGGFPVFTGGDAEVLASCVSRQWVFLCSRLKTTLIGPGAGHPLSVRFPVERPVYPMSLTRSAGTVPLEVFWMGKQVRDPSGRLVVTGAVSDITRHRFKRFYQEFYLKVVARAAHGTEAFENFREHYIEEDRDLLLDQLLHSESVMRFAATFSPASDWSDLQFEPVSEIPQLPRHVTRDWRFEQAIDLVAPQTIATLLLLGLTAQWCGPPGKRPHIAWVMAGLALVLGAAGWAWSQLPKDTVIVENSQLKQPSKVGANSPEELFKEWCRSLQDTKAPQ